MEIIKQTDLETLSSIDIIATLQLAIAELGAQAEANTAETQLAIAELATTILGGE